MLTIKIIRESHAEDACAEVYGPHEETPLFESPYSAEECFFAAIEFLRSAADLDQLNNGHHGDQLSRALAMLDAVLPW